MQLEMCGIRQRPKFKVFLPGHPAAKLGMCKEQLKGTYASSANEMPVKLLQEIHQALKASKLLNKLKDVKVTFSTIDQQSIHPQHGVP